MRRVSAEAAIVALAGAGVTAFQLSRPGLLFGITPDVSAWLGASVRLVHGAVPYRDFFLSQPPGFTVLAAPFAFLSELTGTRDALAVLRLFAPVITAMNVLLVARLLRHRGRAAVVVAASIVALSPAMLYAVQGPMLEPLLAVFCLLGLTMVFDGDAVAPSKAVAIGGAAMGFAVAIKLTALIPVAVLALLLVIAARRRALPYIAGAATGFAIPSIPFIVLAPGQFARDVIGTQLNRVPGTARLPGGPRLDYITGTAWFGGGDAAAIGIILAVAGIAGVAFLLVRRRTTLLDWFLLTAAVTVLLAQLVPALYYPHYAAFTAPFAAALLGVATARIATLRMRRVAATAAVTLCAALVGFDAAALRGLSAPDYARTVAATVPEGACTLSDAPSKLMTSDRFVSARPGCTTVTDPNGEAVALAGDPALAARTWQTAFEQSDYVVTDRPVSAWYIGATPSLLAYIARHFQAEWRNGLLFYVRTSVLSRM